MTGKKSMEASNLTAVKKIITLSHYKNKNQVKAVHPVVQNVADLSFF